MAREYAFQETSPSEHERMVVINDDDTDGSVHSENPERDDHSPERSPSPEHSKSEDYNCTEVFNEEREEVISKELMLEAKRKRK